MARLEGADVVPVPELAVEVAGVVEVVAAAGVAAGVEAAAVASAAVLGAAAAVAAVEVASVAASVADVAKCKSFVSRVLPVACLPVVDVVQRVQNRASKLCQRRHDVSVLDRSPAVEVVSHAHAGV